MEIMKKIVQPMTLYLIIGTVPAVVAAIALRDWLEGAFETGNYLGFAFLATSALLVFAELMSKRAARGAARARSRGMGWLDALVVGLFQAVAVIPGVSRSGATLSGALSRGLDREAAARFSFTLSIPIILGAALFQFREILGDGARASGGTGALEIAVGTLTAALVGFFAVRLMLKIVRERSLWGFAVYTGALGLLVLADRFLIHAIF
jgi:undecaprenyl-diphosphatase